MFTGIIQSQGSIQGKEVKGSDSRLKISVGSLDMTSVEIGDSIAVNGVCLTVISFGSTHFFADVSNETLSKTTLGKIDIGGPVNLEKALTLSTPLGGHLVSGHVDCVGKIIERSNDGRSVHFKVEVPASLAKFVAKKGSICIDGISLTVNEVSGKICELNIVPHTLEKTTMGQFAIGQIVNIEVDLLARYLERLMLGEAAANENATLTARFLEENGFGR